MIPYEKRTYTPWPEVKSYRMLDLFCGAGGASMGYYLTGGFSEIVGVDIKPQKRYPFKFVQRDAIEYLTDFGGDFDFIHASPPCQLYANITHAGRNREKHPDLLPIVSELLQLLGKPYVIENVPRSPMRNDITLCGTMFNLDVIRHRWFETNVDIDLETPECNHYKPVVRCGRRPDLKTQFHSVVGHFIGAEEARQAMGIDWMTRDELSEAIPPAYTKFLGERILAVWDEK